MKQAWVVLSLFAFLALSPSLPIYAAEAPREALIADLRGNASVRMNEGEWKPAIAGMNLQEKDEIKTGGDGYVELLVDGGDSARVEIKENSYFKINTLGFDQETKEKSTLLDLAIGKVMVHAEKLKGDSKFEVRTPTSTTGVRGTAFEVNVEENK